jgi:hypothetical protein
MYCFEESRQRRGESGRLRKKWKEGVDSGGEVG